MDSKSMRLNPTRKKRRRQLEAARDAASLALGEERLREVIRLLELRAFADKSERLAVALADARVALLSLPDDRKRRGLAVAVALTKLRVI
jgi:hypothetical protein